MFGELKRDRVSRLAFEIINAAQNEDARYMAAALGLAMAALEEAHGFSPSEVMTSAYKQLRARGLGDDQYVKALAKFMKDDLNDYTG